MYDIATDNACSERQFAELVDRIALDGQRRQQLVELLREDHSVYDQRGAPAVVRMRGWVMLALSRGELPAAALVFVLEELDTGIDAYLVAAAARALRAYPTPQASFAPFVIRAITHMQYYEEPVSFDGYGEYADSADGPTPLKELFAALVWLGPRACDVLPAIESLRETCEGIPNRLMPELDRALEAVRAGGQDEEGAPDACCTLPPGLASIFSWGRSDRHHSEPIGLLRFEDQSGASITFDQFFQGCPAIVVFFYTRCDNPRKCSLTVSKLAQVQKLLQAEGLAGEIRTAAITYDPLFDDPIRLRRYGLNRDVRFDAHHRMLRCADGVEPLLRHFRLGVNFIDSLVNRHRIEAYVLDAKGRIASRFERLHWSERQVLDRAVEVLNEGRTGASEAAALQPSHPSRGRAVASSVFGVLASSGFAFFPKCPFCWAAYLSLFGVAGLEQLPYMPWLYGVLLCFMMVNLASVWLRSRATRRMTGFYLAVLGTFTVMAAQAAPGGTWIAPAGIFLIFAGSAASAFFRIRPSARATSS